MSMMVHRERPSGTGPQTMAMIAASCRASSFRGGTGRFASLSATSTPEARYRSPTLRTDGTADPSAAAVAANEYPSSNNCSARIRFQVRSVSRSLAMRRKRSRSSCLSLSPGNRGFGGFFSAMAPVDQVPATSANSRLNGSVSSGRGTSLHRDHFLRTRVSPSSSGSRGALKLMVPNSLARGKKLLETGPPAPRRLEVRRFAAGLRCLAVVTAKTSDE